MPLRPRRLFGIFSAGLTLLLAPTAVRAQSFGIELHNTLMPASGGMGGTSIARPQDVTSAINANPATLSQFEGTQFLFGGAWIEPTYDLAHGGGVLPRLGPFAAKSEAEGTAIGGFGLAQDLRALDIPATVGIGLAATAGAGLSFRDVPNSNGTTVTISVLEITFAMGMDVTERLSVGASVMMGTGGLEAPFVGIGAYTYDYALRGAVGLDYDLGWGNNIGFYYQTKQNFNFDDAIELERFDGSFFTVQDIDMDLPDNLGLGIANRCLLDGRLLWAADVLYKQWDNADLFRALYRNQWVFQTGIQYARTPRTRFRLGYAYAQNPIGQFPGGSAGGVTPPGGVLAIQYTQGLVAIVNMHRVSAGFGVRDVLPGIDFDLLAGGMFEASDRFGSFTAASLESYWLGAGITWRFGRGSCRRLPAPDTWCGCE